MWDALLDAMGRLLAFFYDIVPNYGVGIILLTVSIRLVLYPLTAKQARSMAAMQRVQPEIKKLQEKYKQDRQKLNEELMAFYKEHKINPLAGCLPMLAQIPIFFALFQVLRNPAKHIADGTALFRQFCPGVETAAECADAAGLPRGLEFLTMNLSQGATADHGSFIEAVPFWILVGLVVATGYWQSRQMTKLQKGRSTPQAQMMTKIFPVMFGVISISLPAGVVLYFLASNLWQIGQQAVVFGRDPALVGAGGGKGDGGKGKAATVEREGPGERRSWMSRLAAAPTASEEPAAQAEPPPEPPKPPDSRPNRAKSKKRKKRKRRR